MSRLRTSVVLAAAGAAAVAVSVGAPRPFAAASAPAPLTELTVGGGPRPSDNQVAIEGNVRYVGSLLPAGTRSRVLFADGNPQSKIVLYSEPEKAASPAEQALRALFGGPSPERFRAPELRALDGPSEKKAIRAEMDRVAATGDGPVLLYFTGHGSRNRNLDNNFYDLWQGAPPAAPAEAPAPRPGQPPAFNPDSVLTVRDLAAEIKKVPAGRPVTLVMVQCFSGSFANVLFEDGDPTKPMVDRPLCGYFATTRERVAAGCTPEVNEADYKDFTSYFFAALTGKDRTGKLVRAEDYNHDGVIGMDEAFAFALITEPSVDVPVATSDVFLRRFVTASDDDIVKTPFSQVLAMASPSQRAALEGVSKALKATGEDRLRTALADVRARAEAEGGPGGHHASTAEQRTARESFQETRNQLARRFPGLTSSRREQVEASRKGALAYLETKPELVKQISEASQVFSARSEEQYADELTGARWLRLLRVAKSVVLEKKLRDAGDKALIARFDKLKALEAGNPLR